MGDKFLGIDASSTSITAVITDGTEVFGTYKLDMDELAASVGVKTTDGMIEGPDGHYSVPGRVLAAGAQAIMEKIAADDSVSNEELKGASFSVQGHLTGYMNSGIVEALRNPSSIVCLDQQVAAFFTCDCPTWRDSSTGEETARLNELAKEAGLNVITMAERYPGPQIAQRVGTAAYAEADLIMCGNALFPFLLTGNPTFSGPGDAAASGFVDLETLTLDRRAMDLIAGDLHKKVAEVSPPGTCLGEVSSLFKTMGFINLKVYTSDQDNIKSGAYLMFGPSIMQVSLGTSYTVSIVAKSTIPGFEGNFASNDKENPYMLLLCKNNGSESVTKVLSSYGFGESDFAKVSDALQATAAGNNGAMALPWFKPEIIPYAPDADRIIRKGYSGKPDFKTDMRAVVEGNAASMRIWAHNYFSVLGRELIGGIKGISFAGGTTNNPDMLQVWTDMFGAPGYCMAHADNAAAIGAALTAMADHTGQPLQKVVSMFVGANKPTVIQPGQAADVYRATLIPAYKNFEEMHATQR